MGEKKEESKNEQQSNGLKAYGISLRLVTLIESLDEILAKSYKEQISSDNETLAEMMYHAVMSQAISMVGQIVKLGYSEILKNHFEVEKFSLLKLKSVYEYRSKLSRKLKELNDLPKDLETQLDNDYTGLAAMVTTVGVKLGFLESLQQVLVGLLENKEMLNIVTNNDSYSSESQELDTDALFLAMGTKTKA